MSRYRPCRATADMIAFMERRRANCLIMAERNPHQSERATIMRQQLDVLIGDLRAGMHEGEFVIAGGKDWPADDPHDWMEI